MKYCAKGRSECLTVLMFPMSVGYRSDSSVEIWSEKDNWYQEKVSVHFLVWQSQLLYH